MEGFNDVRSNLQVGQDWFKGPCPPEIPKPLCPSTVLAMYCNYCTCYLASLAITDGRAPLTGRIKERCAHPGSYSSLALPSPTPNNASFEGGQVFGIVGGVEDQRHCRVAGDLWRKGPKGRSNQERSE